MTDKLKLTKRQIRQWVNALRSGKYKQTSGTLCADLGEDDDTEDMRFCCLGVACDLFLEGDWERADDGGIRLVVGRKYSLGMPPLELQDAINKSLGFGPEDYNPSKKANKAFEGLEPCEGLAGMNDGGKTFKQIARVIERVAEL